MELAKEPVSVSVIIDALMESYDVSAERLKEDVFTFLKEMESKGLIHISQQA